MKELERFVGLSVYYSKWIPKFSKFAEPLFIARTDGLLPLQKDALDCIDDIKKAVAKAILWIPYRQKPFILETDASGTALGGVLSQEGRPVAFVSHKLSDQEKHWSAIEKEAYAIVWCTQKCRQYLLGSKFTIITDQQGVSYLFDSRPKSSIKNSKLCRWRLALSEYTFDIQYRAGRLNTVADAMSREFAYADADLEKPFISGNIDYILSQVHDKMGHPEVARTVGFIQRIADIPGLQSKVKQHIEKCQVCLELKPRFHSPPVNHLVTSSTPWERISIDFVGLKKPSKGGNCYFLTVVDEFSRFPFAFAMKEGTTANTIKALNQLFMLFGPPESVHSDRGSVFESHDFRSFLERWNVRKTRTTPYNPAGNGQCERVNGIIWRTVKLRLKLSSKSIVLWDEELPAALVNVRSLGSCAIGFESPHNRFFGFSRRSSLDLQKEQMTTRLSPTLTPAWMRAGEPIYVKNFNKTSKDDPLVQPATVVKVLSPHHAVVAYTDKNTVDTVNTKYVARGTTAESTDGRSGSGKDVLVPDDADSSVPDVTKRAVDVQGTSSLSTIDESETLKLPNTSQTAYSTVAFFAVRG